MNTKQALNKFEMMAAAGKLGEKSIARVGNRIGGIDNIMLHAMESYSPEIMQRYTRY